MIRKILFVCIHNSARSQMAEAFINRLAPDRFLAQSAGLEPGKLNPVVVEVMNEIGFDLSSNKTKSVHDFIKSGEQFEYIITVCDEASAERCPVFPGKGIKMHLNFPDPSALRGSQEEKLRRTRQIRDQIRMAMEQWLRKVEG